jgi:hypothetical protein
MTAPNPHRETTKVVSSNLAHGEVYLIKHYMIKFTSDLQQVYGFLGVLGFPSPIKLTATHAIPFEKGFYYISINPYRHVYTSTLTGVRVMLFNVTFNNISVI